MKHNMLTAGIVTECSFWICLAVYLVGHSAFWLAFCVSFGVMAYHLWIYIALEMGPGRRRGILHRRKCFRVGTVEERLYQLLGVRYWRRLLPAFRPAAFDLRRRSCEDVLRSSALDEVIHLCCIPLRFLPLVLIPQFGLAAILTATSIAAVFFDLAHIMMQRGSRPAILRRAAKEVKQELA